MSTNKGKSERETTTHGDARAAGAGSGDQEAQGGEASSTEERQGSGASNLAYDFRILPVDPKNSFDFEDVADK